MKQFHILICTLALALGPVAVNADPEDPAVSIPDSLAGPLHEPPPKSWPADDVWAGLLKGSIHVIATHEDESGGAALAQALFYIDAESLWAVLGDCERNYRFVRGLKACEILKEDERTALTRQTLKPYALLPRFDYEFETYRQPFEWIRIRLVEGNLKALNGSWRFDWVPEQGALLVTHEIQVQPRMMVPRWLARRTVRKDLVSLLACLRWESRAWPDAKQRGQDRERCPA